MLKLVILDRDGVINHDSDQFIKSPAEWKPIDGSLEAIVRLKNAGLRVAVASNQSGLARGLFDHDALFSIHDKMQRMLADLGTEIDGIFFCPHAADAACRCRKPATGLLEDIMNRWGVAAGDCVLVGDRMSDIHAAQASGIEAIGVRSGKEGDALIQANDDVTVFSDLAAVADHLLAESVRR